MNIEFPAYITLEDIAEAKIECLAVYERTGGKIEAIKYVRQRLSVGLKEAKDFFCTQVDPVELAEVERKRKLREAAPDLLAALQSFLAPYEGFSDEELYRRYTKVVLDHDTLKAIRKARAAIAKATS